jgi:hypothetical protein
MADIGSESVTEGQHPESRSSLSTPLGPELTGGCGHHRPRLQSARPLCAGDLGHVLTGVEFDPLAGSGIAQCPLMGIQPVPPERSVTSNDLDIGNASTAERSRLGAAVRPSRSASTFAMASAASDLVGPMSPTAPA